MKQEKINLENPAIFKGKDIGLVKAVNDIFNDCEISPKIVGGLQRNLGKGFLRTYRDIDLKVEPGNKDSEQFQNYVEAIRTFYHLSKKEDGELGVEDITEQLAMYVGTEVNYRFRVFSPKTRTTVDITFGKHPDSDGELRGEKYIKIPTSCAPLMHFPRKHCTWFD